MVKNEDEIEGAELMVDQHLHTPGISPMQKAMLHGITVGLAWCRGSPHTATMDKLLAGYEITVNRG